MNEELKDEDGEFRLEKSQIGFRYGLGCEVNILRLIESLRHMRELNKDGTQKIWSYYVDLKSAFDSVDHEILFKKMDEIGISQKLNNTI